MSRHPAVELPPSAEIEEDLIPPAASDTTIPVGMEATRLVALLLDSEPSRGLVHITADGQRAEEVARCLAGLLPEWSVLVFPPHDALPHEQPSAEVVGLRMRVLRRLASEPSPVLVLTSPEAVLERVPPTGALRSFTIAAGRDLDVEALRRFCEEAGYAIDERVDEPGEVAIRGAVIDIFPGGLGHPVRLDLDGAEVTGIRSYDPVTQRTAEAQPEVVLDAVRPVSEADRSGTLLDHLPDARIVESPGAPANRRRFLALVAEAAREQQGEADTRACLGAADWQALAEERGLRTLDLSGCEATPRFVAAARPGAALAAFLQDCLVRKQRVILAAATPRDLSRLERRVLAGGLPSPERVDDWRAACSGPPRLVSLQVSLDRGFVDAERDLVVVTADDLFGSATATGDDAPSAAALWQVEIAELHLGDLVVHADHGVGRLEGLEPVVAGDVHGEAIRLGYHGGETLLVPTAEAGKLWRYGSEDTDVPLARLSGNAWSKRREQAAAAVAETGRRLVAEMNERRARPAPKLVPPRRCYERFAARFPFRLTLDQGSAIEAALADLVAGFPMNRLVVGDVGFGKTEVALRAAAAAALAGVQVAVVAPTTVLARQHHDTFRRRFASVGMEVAHLSRLVRPAEARRVRAGLKDGSIRVVVGTHALLGKTVAFDNLGLLVIDEEQRFGAAHKAALRRLGQAVHVLAMTATPIPRTLQSALVGLQSLSVIATPPLRRRPIRTLVEERDRSKMRWALLRERRRGGQSFVVVPRVEDIASVERELDTLVPELALRVAHGQMPANEIDEAMVGFAEGRGDVLLATSIIESGLDVPRANTMVVLSPDRFGLAQLHQLRGRVGRGHAQAYCYLMTDAGSDLSETATRRLAALAALERLGSGLAISVQDLDQRGAGELFGDRQTGHVRLIGLGLYQELLAAAIREARGEPHPPAEVALQIDTAGVIPADYVPEPVVRINLYQRLARVRSLAEADRLADEIADRFGPIPPPLEAPLQAARLRALAATLGVVRISAGPEGVALAFDPRAGVPEACADVLDRLDAIDWNGERLLLRRPSGTPEESRALAVDLLLQLD